MHLPKKFNHWQIAYRNNGTGEFTLVPNPPYGWAADPFLIEYGGKIYLFAEIFLYKSERNGVIGYCEYNGNAFGEWKITMDRHWHLSYPFVFVQSGKLYMCPESIQSEEVSIYELVKFPDSWKKVKTLINNGKYSDSTFFGWGNETYMFTYRHTHSLIEGTLCLYKWGEDGDFQVKELSSDIGSARPGGKVIAESERIIRVSQNSEGGYGAGLVFSVIDSVWPEYREHIIRKVFPADIEIEQREKYIGLHTYNRCQDIEVIDLKYETFSMAEYTAQKRVRKVFLNKY